jgi:3-dehydroquinate synthase/shikimate kinase/3-dehydroquinate synthase
VEAWAGYSGKVLHGEAVALGMMLAAQFSHRQGLCDQSVPERLGAHLANSGFATSFTASNNGNAANLRSQIGAIPTVQELLHFMEQDKKVRDGQMTFILLRSIGEAFVARNVDRGEIAAFLDEQLTPLSARH